MTDPPSIRFHFIEERKIQNLDRASAMISMRRLTFFSCVAEIKCQSSLLHLVSFEARFGCEFNRERYKSLGSARHSTCTRTTAMILLKGFFALKVRAI